LHDDLLGDFTGEAPNQLWLSDIPLCDQRRILQPDRRLLQGLTDEIGAGHHRSAQPCGQPRRDGRLAAKDSATRRARYGMVGSVGRVGTAGDTAAMESFFSLLQNNVLDRDCCDTRAELRIAIITWIERTYHRRRRRKALGRLAPANSKQS
jgi:transposase InsO family protein